MLGKLRTSSALPPLNETPNLGAFIVLNDELEWSRGKRAAHAAHALLGLYGITYSYPSARAAVFLYTGELFERVEIHSATAELVRQQRVVVRDQGRTEIPRGSVTAGASWTA